MESHCNGIQNPRFYVSVNLELELTSILLSSTHSNSNLAHFLDFYCLTNFAKIIY